MRLRKIIKELERAFGNDKVKNCVVFWESPKGLRMSMFPKDLDSFAAFMAQVADITGNPDKYLPESKLTYEGKVEP